MHITFPSIVQILFIRYCNYRFLEAEGYTHWHYKVQLFADIAVNFVVISFSEFKIYPSLLDEYENSFHTVLHIRLGLKKKCLKHFLFFQSDSFSNIHYFFIP